MYSTVEYDIFCQNHPRFIREDVLLVSYAGESQLQLQEVVQVDTGPGSIVRRSLRVPFDL